MGAQQFGAAIHTALAAGGGAAAGRTVPAAGARHQRLVSDGFRDAEQSAAWRDFARDMVERYVADLDPYEEPIGVERTVATRTEKVALSGRIDRLDDRGGDLVVVDYKTGRHILDTDDARGSLALAVYAIAAARTMRRPCRRVELHHPPAAPCVLGSHRRVAQPPAAARRGAGAGVRVGRRRLPGRDRGR